jgi:hypothetical protein
MPNLVRVVVKPNFRAAALRVATWILLVAACSFAGQQATVSSGQDPADLVRKAVQNEIKAANDSSVQLQFRSTKTTPKGSTTKLYVQTKDATAGLTIAYNGKPLTPEQRRAEESRAGRFVNNREELRKKHDQERQDAARMLRILRALPDAFLYEYAGQEPGSEGVGRTGAALVKLKFRPNPHYEPPTRIENVLTGMEGYVLVDTVHQRLASIEGTLFKTVSFGWGVLGHLDRGGRFIVHQQQVQVDDNVWAISSMTLKLTGKMLLVKSFSVNSTEVFSGFKRVPADLTFSQALELLKKEEPATAESAAVGKFGQR